MKLLFLLALVAVALWFVLRFARKQPQETTRPAPTGADMSPDEAMKVLGLTPPVDRDMIIEAHRKLMQKVHPDHGGSTYLAQQLNEAKRVLLRTRAQ